LIKSHYQDKIYIIACYTTPTLSDLKLKLKLKINIDLSIDINLYYLDDEYNLDDDADLSMPGFKIRIVEDDDVVSFLEQVVKPSDLFVEMIGN
jgi:hypothetical protein